VLVSRTPTNRPAPPFDTRRTLKIWRGGKCVRTLEGHEGPVLSLAVTPDGDVLSGSGDTTIRRWGGRSGVCTHVYRGHTDTVRCVCTHVVFLSSSLLLLAAAVLKEACFLAAAAAACACMRGRAWGSLVRN
jgi:WD40 repeat protein